MTPETRQRERERERERERDGESSSFPLLHISLCSDEQNPRAKEFVELCFVAPILSPGPNAISENRVLATFAVLFCFCPLRIEVLRPASALRLLRLTGCLEFS